MQTGKKLPLCLISQIQRSGGTMMSQLLDGHPELLSHPWEIIIGYPTKFNWPELDINKTHEEWFEILGENDLYNMVEKGYVKPDSNKFARNERFKFDLSLPKLKLKFSELLSDKPPKSQREILDAYFYAFFFSWESYNITGKEKYVSGFTPRVLMLLSNIERLNKDYPDGKFISLIRNPISWYASSSRHSKTYQDVDKAIQLWRHSAKTSMTLQNQLPRNYKCYLFEDIISSPEDSMRSIANYLGIEYLPILLKPTFLNKPILPNSSFSIKEKGINKAMLNRADTLTQETKDKIKSSLGVYEKAKLLCGME